MARQIDNGGSGCSVQGAGDASPVAPSLAEKGRGEGTGEGKTWDYLDRYKNLRVFDGNSKDFEEWNVKFRSLINAGDQQVGGLPKAVEH